MNEAREGRDTLHLDLKQLLENYERTLILQALAAATGHQRRAASALGILPTTLHEKMKRLGIPTRTAAARARAAEDTTAATTIEAA
jgi:DNA-binding NtrC family response regulator